jgi:glycosyltransferase involved in cell wall biosynthesis
VLKRALGVKYIFDMRGFWADERADGGSWRRGSILYRLAKHYERKFLAEADVVVSLTKAAVREMQAFPYLEERRPVFAVIPTCTDLTLFRRAAFADDGVFVLGYVGSVGSYYLFEHVARAFRLLRERRPTARLLIINRGQHGHIRDVLAVHGIDSASVEIVAADYNEMAAYIARMNAGIFFIVPSFSKRASSPTKLGEFLACGRPCLSNAGVGDVEEVLRSNRVGVVVRGFGDDELRAGVDELLALASDDDTANRCVATAHAELDLAEGVRRYDAIYESLRSTKELR